MMNLKTILASAFAVVSLTAVLATPAAATCQGCDYGAGFDFGAGGEAVNEGEAWGGLTGVFSTTTKHVYGGGDASDSTNGHPKANAYAGAHFATQGGSIALSGGLGHSQAGTSEYGMIQGGGMANAWKQRINN